MTAVGWVLHLLDNDDDGDGGEGESVRGRTLVNIVVAACLLWLLIAVVVVAVNVAWEGPATVGDAASPGPAPAVVTYTGRAAVVTSCRVVDGVLEAGGTVTNTGTWARSYTIGVELFDGPVRLRDATATTRVLAPGASATWTAASTQTGTAVAYPGCVLLTAD